jgi:hypothetical protein
VSEVTSLIIDIFQAKKNDVGSLARYRSRQLSRIDAIARVQRNWHNSPKPEDRKGHIALLTVSSWRAPMQRSRGHVQAVEGHRTEPGRWNLGY